MKAILVLAMLLLICDPALAEPQNVESLLSQGRSYYANGFLQNALEAFENATLLDPTNAPAWHDKGMVLQRLGRTEEAVEALKKAEGLTSKSETEQTKVVDEQPKVTSKLKTVWEDYNTEAYQNVWFVEHQDIARQLNLVQGVELVIFRESNAEKMNISSGMDKVNATRIVNAIDGVFAANRDGTIASAELMNYSLSVLQELAPEHCGEGTAIWVLAKNFDSWSHGGTFVCTGGAMCYDPVNNPDNAEDIAYQRQLVESERKKSK